MVEFLEDHEKWLQRLPSQNDITVCFQINFDNCIQQPQQPTRSTQPANHILQFPTYNCTNKRAIFGAHVSSKFGDPTCYKPVAADVKCFSKYLILNNLEWRLEVRPRPGTINIQLECSSNIQQGWNSSVNSRITLMNTERKERLRSEFLPEQNFNINGKSKCLCDYNVGANDLKNGVASIELWINVYSNPQSLLDNGTFLKWFNKIRQYFHLHQQKLTELVRSDVDGHQEEVAQLKATNTAQLSRIEELTHQLAYYEEDKESIEMFKHILRLFETQHCSKFENDMRLANNVNVHIQVTSTHNNDTERADEKSQLEQERDDLKAEVAKLQQQLNMLQVK